LFKAVLEAMDFKVTPLAAEVLWGRDPQSAPEATPQLTHMALIVDIGGAPYLADVGFGGSVMTAPIRLRADLEQETPHGRYRLLGGQPLWRLESEIEGAWRPLYQFDLTARTLDDYIAMNDVTAGMFKDNLIAARIDGNKRLALRNARLRIHEGPETTTRALASLAELREVLAGTFGIALPESDRLDPALEKALRPGAND
jgi:N-hydroxyarylamine O-acetyltransferase